MKHHKKRTLRLLHWIRKYPGWWMLICTPGAEHMDAGMMKMLVQRLAKEEFYEVIFVLLTVHRNADFMDSVYRYMLLDLVITGWEGAAADRESIVQQLTRLLT